MRAEQKAQQLRDERAALALADGHIRAGTLRVQEQEARVILLRARGQNVELAERLAENLRGILDGWHDHRRLIRDHIALLERETSDC